MANEVYVCIRRTDIPNGVLQVLDLEPNESQRNLVYTTPGQTKYLRNYQNSAVSTYVSGVDRHLAGSTSGLAAYLIDRVEAGGLAAGTDALTATQANDAAAAIVAIVTAGTDATLADVDAAIAGVVADTELSNAGGSASFGTLADVLAILSGAEYTVPGGTRVAAAGVLVATAGGSFDTGAYRQLYATSSFVLSNNVGKLNALKQPTFEYAGATGAAISVYDESGNAI